ncbi:hypothetical protein Goshw_004913 [Gossypium schwendimanii]|uniref:DUF7745 domain-containing protein n=1 Tax=Gossypium schwendimanii TaxID=34291 RepID=A0A7J9NF60_GOSSC|nr:hypothetical protein [Gossypium schwendimanii]
MEKGFLDRVEDNAAVRTWAEMMQCEKGDSLVEGYISELWDFTRVSVTQNNLQELKEIWDQWNNEVSCFTFGNVDLVPTIEEYMILLLCSKDLILAHLDARKKVDVFALSIYGLVVFPKTLGQVDEVVTDLFDRLEKRVTPVSVILAETFRSLNACRRAGEGRFIGCAQLLLAWFHNHFWKVDKVLYWVFSESYSPLKEIEDIEWRAPWLLPDEILYRCGDFDWVSLIGIWGAVSYAPLLVLRQYRSRQFVPATQGLAECEFSYRGDGYKKRVREMVSTWSHTYRMKRLAVGLMITFEYSE